MKKFKQETRERLLTQTFRPELINRLDAVIWFSALTKENLMQIARLLLDKTSARLQSLGISLTVSHDALQAIAKAASTLNKGARPLRRLIGDQIENLLANRYLLGEIQAGDCVSVLYEDDTFRLQINRA